MHVVWFRVHGGGFEGGLGFMGRIIKEVQGIRRVSKKICNLVVMSSYIFSTLLHTWPHINTLSYLLTNHDYTFFSKATTCMPSLLTRGYPIYLQEYGPPPHGGKE